MPSVRALRAILDDDSERIRLQEYIADVTCLLTKRLCRAEIPLYTMTKRQRVKRYDSRSGNDIVKDIVAKRRKKRAQRGGENK